jgi:imidazolonepropionase-like amidohydrolase
MLAIRAPRAFDGERFVDGGATVLVDGERIAGVEAGGFDPPAGAEVAEYDGTLLPGLVDTHVHLVSDASLGWLGRAGELDGSGLDAMIAASLHAQAAGGVTTVRDLGDRRYRAVAARDRADPGLPRILASGPPLTTPAGHCHYLGAEATGVEAVRAVVADHVAHGVDVVKVMASGGMLTAGTDVYGVQFSPGELRAAVDVAHQAGVPLVAHAHSLAGAWHALEAGADGIEHLTCLTEAGQETPDTLLEALAASGTVVGPTVGQVLERLVPPERMPPQLRAVVERMGLTPERFRAMRAEQLTRVRAHGVTVVCGLDAGAGPPKPHGALWVAVDWLSDAYPVAEAMAAATSLAADVCGLGEVTGRLQPGLAADLLVVDGDLEHDVLALSRPVAVWVRGSAVTR